MRLTLGLLLFTLYMTPAFAMKIKIDDWRKNRDMDRSILLFTQSMEERLNLDCQSFIQGLWFGEFEEARVIGLEPNQCMALLNRIKTSIKRGSSHCMEIEDTIKKDYRCR